jgi:hypothetical protein
VTDLPKDTEDRLKQNWKAPCDIVITELGIVIDVRRANANASVPIEVTDLPIDTNDRLSQREKAESDMVMTESGIVTEVRGA